MSAVVTVSEARTFRKFLHCRPRAKLVLVLAVTAFLTLAVLQQQQQFKLDSRSRARWRTQRDSADLNCAAPVQELDCAIPAFTAEWSIVPGVDMQIYSAHLDNRLKVDGETQNFIRAIGLLRKSATQVRLFCLANLASGEQITSRVSLDKVWIDSWDNGTVKDFLTPYIISCQIGADLREVPISVSFVTDPCGCPSNRLRLRRPAKQPRRDFMVCTKGLFFTRDNSRELMQWMEMLFLLGAKHIHMYSYRLPKNTRRMLKFYQRYRGVTVQKITLPPREFPQGLGFAQNLLFNLAWQKRRLELVPYNDCYYRYNDKFEYIVLLDVDELIVPRDPDVASWTGLMAKVKEVKPNAIDAYASFAFSNAYFFRDANTSMDVLAQTRRSANLSAPGSAIKSIFTADGSLAVFNHYALIPLRPTVRKCAIVGSDIGLLHHYRDSCPRLMDAQCRDNFMKYFVQDDTVPAKFGRRLQQSLASVAHDMKNALF